MNLATEGTEGTEKGRWLALPESMQVLANRRSDPEGTVFGSSAAHLNAKIHSFLRALRALRG